MNERILESRKKLKAKLRSRELMFGGWISYAHPSITETFAEAGFDLILIDMEHSTISVEQGQRIIASSQAYNIPCVPRPVSHSNDYIKPLLESGSDGLLIQMVESKEQVRKLIDLTKYPPVGCRTYGVNRAQSYGFCLEEYIDEWNDSSSLMIQIESKKGVDNIEEILSFSEVDGVMIGPLDLAGSLGHPGEVSHPEVIEASRHVINQCKIQGISCGTQLADVSEVGVKKLMNLGYTYLILGSDLFVLWQWASQMKMMMSALREDH